MKRLKEPILTECRKPRVYIQNCLRRIKKTRNKLAFKYHSDKVSRSQNESEIEFNEENKFVKKNLNNIEGVRTLKCVLIV